MKLPLIAAFLLFNNCGIFAQDIIVFSKGDTLALRSGTASAGFEDP